MESVITMKPRDHWNQRENFFAALNMELDEDDQDEYYDEVVESFIQEAKYEKVSPREVAEKQKHLTTHQQKFLKERLSKFDKLFDGTLGHYKQKQVHLEIEEDAVPVHSKAYSVTTTSNRYWSTASMRTYGMGLSHVYYSQETRT